MFDFIIGQRFGACFKVFLPYSVGTNILFVAVYEAVYNIIAVGSSYVVLKQQLKHSFILPQKPSIIL